MQVGRVGYGDKDALAAFDQRQDLVLGQQVLVDQFADLDVHSQRFEIQGRHAEFMGSGLGYILRVGKTVVDQVVDQRGFFFLCGRNGLLHDFLGADLFLHQASGQTSQMGFLCSYRHL